MLKGVLHIANFKWNRLCLDCRGSAISKIIGENTHDSALFEEEVKMWVFEEIIDGKKLSETINEKHENVKYLAGIRLPDNVV